MAELLGIIGSVISIAQAAKICIDMFEFVSDAKYSSKEIDQLISRLKLEKVFFCLWCEKTGLEKVMATSTMDEEMEQDARRNIPLEMQRDFILEAISGVLRNILLTFIEFDDRLKRHTYDKSTSSSPAQNASPLTTKIQGRVFLDAGGIELIDRSESSRSSSPRLGSYFHSTNTPRASAAKISRLTSAITWAATDKKKILTMVDQLRLQNQALHDILDLTTRTRFDRQFEILATSTPIAVSLLDLPDEGAAKLPAEYHETKKLIEIAQLNSALNSSTETDPQTAINNQSDRLSEDLPEDSILKNKEKYRQDALQLPPLLQFPAPQLYLIHSDISLLESPPPNSKAIARTIGKYQDQPAFVEWKHYSTNIAPALLSNLKRRVDMLSLQLQRSSETNGFSVLPCIGYFDDEQHNRIGIVFRRLNNTTPITLRDRMARDRRSNRIRELNQRFNVAKKIVLAIYRMHSVGWLHKSVISENVLLFEAPDDDPLHLPTPYLCGFDFSRPDAPNEMTERIPSIMIQVYNDQERMLYRHPDLDWNQLEGGKKKVRSQAQRYRKEYDIYGLGIILLEIGLWYPVKDLSRKGESITDFREKLLNKYLPELRYRMGDRYFKVVQKCLCGGFGDSKDTDLMPSEYLEPEERYIREYEQTQRFIQAFARDAVEELEKCTV